MRRRIDCNRLPHTCHGIKLVNALCATEIVYPLQRPHTDFIGSLIPGGGNADISEPYALSQVTNVLHLNANDRLPWLPRDCPRQPTVLTDSLISRDQKAIRIKCGRKLWNWAVRSIGLDTRTGSES